ncbi:hypothetical protein J6590_020926 [Homalodisca vitripennis]|nr:hypothetical protein J6590_020926 [Homalodisca vitripennis]
MACEGSRAKRSFHKFVEEDVLEWLTTDNKLNNEVLNDEEIAQLILQRQDTQDVEEDNVDGGVDNKGKMSHAKGVAALHLATTYIEQQLIFFEEVE